MRWVVHLCVVALVLWFAGFLWFWLTLPAPASGMARTDGIVALTGGEGRLQTAVDLLDAGRARRLLITGVHPDTGKRQLAVQLGVSRDLLDCCVDLDHEAGNTVGNARSTVAWVARHKVRSLRLVTSDYHMPRALLEYRAAMPEVEMVPHPVVGTLRPLGMMLEYAKYSVRLITIRLDGVAAA